MSKNNASSPATFENKAGVIFTEEHVSFHHRVFLSDEILDVHSYAHFVHLFETALPEDTIFLYLANLGGEVDSCVYIANAMKACNALIYVIVNGRCCSAGATIALCGHSIELRPDTYLMFHNYSSVDYGKGNELRQSVDETRKWIHGYFNRLHSPFLTETEVKMIEKDQDVYVHWDDKDLISRLKRHYPHCKVMKVKKEEKK